MSDDGRIPRWTVEVGTDLFEAEVATVERFHLGYEDHGIFTVDLAFTNGSLGQSLPGRGLDEYDRETRKRHGTAFGCDFIIECIRRIGSPEQAVGRRVVVLRRQPFSTIEGFAALNDDGSYGEPFIPATLAARHFPAVVA